MRSTLLAAGLIVSLAASASAPGVAGAHDHYWHHHYYHNGCEAHRRRAGAIGAIAGTIGGGLIGGAVSHGNLGGTLLGAGGGALIGHTVAKGSVHC